MKVNTLSTNPDVKLSTKERLAFSVGDLFGGGAQSLVATVYLVFLVMNGLSATAAGTIIMVAKIWDAVTDPMMGIISDNTRSKWGRRKPYLFAGGFCIIVSFAFLFLPLHAMQSQLFKGFIYLLSYLFYNTVSTMIMVPYSSFATEMTSNYYEKNKMNTIRLIFSMFSGALSAGVPIILIEKLNKGEMPIQTFSIIMIVGFGLFYSIPLIITSVICQERLPISEKKLKFSFANFLKPLKLRAFVYLLLMYLFAYSCMDIISVNIVWFVSYGLNVQSYSAFILLVVIMASYAAMIPVHNALMKRNFAKPLLFRVGIPLYMIGIAMLGLYPTSFNDYLILPICVIIGVGMSGSQLLPWFIFPDVVDLGELKFSSRNTGSFSGLMTFTRKTTVAIAIGISGFILDVSGFVKPTTDLLTGLVTSYDQPMSAVWGLRLVIMIPIITFMALAYTFAKKLKLNPKRSVLISKMIAEPAIIDTLNEDDRAEYEAIKKELF
jgi:Na+/melibiose symporter-like transporter